jgi:hypothetical protein
MTCIPRCRQQPRRVAPRRSAGLPPTCRQPQSLQDHPMRLQERLKHWQSSSPGGSDASGAVAPNAIDSHTRCCRARGPRHPPPGVPPAAHGARCDGGRATCCGSRPRCGGPGHDAPNGAIPHGRLLESIVCQLSSMEAELCMRRLIIQHGVGGVCWQSVVTHGRDGFSSSASSRALPPARLGFTQARPLAGPRSSPAGDPGSALPRALGQNSVWILLWFSKLLLA